MVDAALDLDDAYSWWSTYAWLIFNYRSEEMVVDLLRTHKFRCSKKIRVDDNKLLSLQTELQGDELLIMTIFSDRL